MNHFSDPQAGARYAEGAFRNVPGLAGLHRMTTLLLAERAPADARMLVLGAGGGLELKVFAEANNDWQFDGVDPSAEMLKLAEATLGAHAARVTLHEGYIDAAPNGPFDAAACLLTFHFVRPEERARTLGEVHRRLKAGAPFVVAHLSFPQREPEREVWLSRYFGFSGIKATDSTRAAINSQLTILAPEVDEGFKGWMLVGAGILLFVSVYWIWEDFVRPAMRG